MSSLLATSDDGNDSNSRDDDDDDDSGNNDGNSTHDSCRSHQGTLYSFEEGHIIFNAKNVTV